MAEPIVEPGTGAPIPETPMLGAWRAQVEAAVDADRPGWDEFTVAVTAAVAQRHEALPRIIDHAMKSHGATT